MYERTGLTINNYIANVTNSQVDYKFLRAKIRLSTVTERIFMKRIMALCLFTAVLLTSCGEKSQPDTETSGIKNDDTSTAAAETTDPSRVSDLPEKYDLGDYELTVAKTSPETNFWALGTFAVDEENGEVLNDAIYRRNLERANTRATPNHSR